MAQITNGELSQIFFSSVGIPADEQTVDIEESGPEQGLEHRAEECSRSGDVLSVEKRLGHLSRKQKLALTRASGCACVGIPWVCLASGNTYGGFYCPSALRVIVYDALILANIKVARLLRPGNTPDRWRNIPPNPLISTTPVLETIPSIM